MSSRRRSGKAQLGNAGAGRSSQHQRAPSTHQLHGGPGLTAAATGGGVQVGLFVTIAVSAPHGYCGQRTRFSARSSQLAELFGGTGTRHRDGHAKAPCVFPQSTRTTHTQHSLSFAHAPSVAAAAALARILVAAPRIDRHRPPRNPACVRRATAAPLLRACSFVPRLPQVSRPWVSYGKA